MNSISWNKYIFIKLITFVLLITVLPFQAFSTDITPYASKYITSYDRYIWRNSNGSIGVEFDVTATGTMDEIGAKQITIQKKNGNSWEDVKTFTSSTTPSLMGKNTYYYTSSVTYSAASPTSTYRARISIYVGNSSGSDSRIITTTSV